MYCKNCGKQLPDGAKFCDACAAPQDGQVQVGFNNQAVQQPKSKKPIYKKWWFWVIIVVVLIAVYGIAMSNKNQTNSDTNETTVQAVTTVEGENETTAEPTTAEPTTEEPTQDPAIVEEEFKNSCESISFEDLSRNPDKYKDNKYTFTGEVIQVQENDSWLSDTTQVDLRINVTKKTYEYLDEDYWEDTIYATIELPEGADRILEDDIITIWGTCDGNYTYESVLGNKVSLPKIDVEYYSINN
jgi:hypothetical protein